MSTQATTAKAINWNKVFRKTFRLSCALIVLACKLVLIASSLVITFFIAIFAGRRSEIGDPRDQNLSYLSASERAHLENSYLDYVDGDLD